MAQYLRADGRACDQLRPITVKRGFIRTAQGSALISAGGTRVLCTATISSDIPPWMKTEENPRGWVTAEYSMLPTSTTPRKKRDREGKTDGRTTEIQRLIGRSLRAVTDLEKLGPRCVTVDCDVLEADGGTRTLSITGAMIAFIDALRKETAFSETQASWPLRDTVAAVSVGLVHGNPLLDLCYTEDFAAEVDMNVVMTSTGRFVEIQGTGEEATFSDRQLSRLLSLARKGIAELSEIQHSALKKR